MNQLIKKTLMVAIGTGALLSLTGCDTLVSKAEDAIRQELKDPDSAKFTEVRRCEKPNAVMGKVNAKNSYGGYTGATPFYYVDGDVAILGAGDSLATSFGGDAEKFAALMKRCFSDKINAQVEAEESKFLQEINAAEAAVDVKHQ